MNWSLEVVFAPPLKHHSTCLMTLIPYRYTEWCSVQNVLKQNPDRGRTKRVVKKSVPLGVGGAHL